MVVVGQVVEQVDDQVGFWLVGHQVGGSVQVADQEVESESAGEGQQFEVAPPGAALFHGVQVLVEGVVLVQEEGEVGLVLLDVLCCQVSVDEVLVFVPVELFRDGPEETVAVPFYLLD